MAFILLMMFYIHVQKERSSHKLIVTIILGCKPIILADLMTVIQCRSFNSMASAPIVLHTQEHQKIREHVVQKFVMISKNSSKMVPARIVNLIPDQHQMAGNANQVNAMRGRSF